MQSQNCCCNVRVRGVGRDSICVARTTVINRLPLRLTTHPMFS
jgi:hypothetical protein